MQLELLCPHCEQRMVCEAPRRSQDCAACGARVLLQAEPAAGAEEPVRSCWVCGSEALFTQKDFNRKLGLAIVAAGGALLFWSFLWGMAALVAMALVDWWLYRVLPSVTVCYACKSVYRGLPLNPDHGAYDLSIDEAFEGTRQAVHQAPAAGDGEPQHGPPGA